MITKEQAVALRLGQILHHVDLKDSVGQPLKARVMGKCKTWKTREMDFEIPMKYGMYQHFKLNLDNCQYWELPVTKEESK